MIPRWIDAKTVERLTPFGPLMDWLEARHREPPAKTERVLMQDESRTGPPNAFLTLPAWAPGAAMGVKIATVFPQNEEETDGPPTVQAVYQLFDGRDGRPAALIDGTMMTLRKTAADSALGARLLAPARPARLLMVGAGSLCRHLIEAHRAARPSLTQIAIWNRTPARSAEKAAALRAEGVAAEATTDLEAAARAADVICCATMSDRPLILGDWLKPGCHLDLVGGYTPAMREADDAAAARARIFVDSRPFTLGCVGDLTQPMAAGVVDERDVLADLYQLAQGAHPGRGDDAAAVTLFKNGGGGHLDLMTARFVAAAASG
ncbi:MAG: ornithine cyclodeaminase family protein [Marivibrio sp.]|uniref:ornithine cyclodeaminase family protein n=1 Tax=Marivibrio sp. TaxID=2039719 RepID=UPI0032EBBB85